MTLIVRVRDVVNEMDVLSDEHHAYLNQRTGELITISNEEIRAVEEGHDIEAYPGWQQQLIQQASRILDSDDYLLLPSKFELNEYSIMERFCYSVADLVLSNELLYQIRGAGAFRRFKDAIYRYDLVDEWYRYRQKALEQMAIDWLEANGIGYETDKAVESNNG
jgi:hypothetical protein